MFSTHLAALCAALRQPVPAAADDGSYSIAFPEKFTLMCSKDGTDILMEMGLCPLPSSPAARGKMCRAVLEYSAARLSREYHSPLLIPCLHAEELRLRLRLPLDKASEPFLEQSLRLYDAGVLWRAHLQKEEFLFPKYIKSNIPIVIFG